MSEEQLLVESISKQLDEGLKLFQRDLLVIPTPECKMSRYDIRFDLTKDQKKFLDYTLSHFKSILPEGIELYEIDGITSFNLVDLLTNKFKGFICYLTHSNL